MVHNQKLSYEDRLHIAKDVVNHRVSILYIARRYGISRRWVRAIAREHRQKVHRKTQNRHYMRTKQNISRQRWF